MSILFSIHPHHHHHCHYVSRFPPCLDCQLLTLLLSITPSCSHSISTSQGREENSIDSWNPNRPDQISSVTVRLAAFKRISDASIDSCQRSVDLLYTAWLAAVDIQSNPILSRSLHVTLKRRRRVTSLKKH